MRNETQQDQTVGFHFVQPNLRSAETLIEAHSTFHSIHGVLQVKGRFTTEEESDRSLEEIHRVVEKLLAGTWTLP